MTEKNVMDQAHHVIQEQSNRLQAMARDEVTKGQEQAYNVYERKDVKTAEHVIAMNRLQLELRQMEHAEVHQRAIVGFQFAEQQVYLQSTLDRQQEVWQERQAELYERFDRKYEALQQEYQERLHVQALDHQAKQAEAAARMEEAQLFAVEAQSAVHGLMIKNSELLAGQGD